MIPQLRDTKIGKAWTNNLPKSVHWFLHNTWCKSLGRVGYRVGAATLGGMNPPPGPSMPPSPPSPGNPPSAPPVPTPSPGNGPITITWFVFDAATRKPIEGAYLTLAGYPTEYTDGYGHVVQRITPGFYAFSINLVNYISVNSSVVLMQSQTVPIPLFKP